MTPFSTILTIVFRQYLLNSWTDILHCLQVNREMANYLHTMPSQVLSILCKQGIHTPFGLFTFSQRKIKKLYEMPGFSNMNYLVELYCYLYRQAKLTQNLNVCQTILTSSVTTIQKKQQELQDKKKDFQSMIQCFAGDISSIYPNILNKTQHLQLQKLLKFVTIHQLINLYNFSHYERIHILLQNPLSYIFACIDYLENKHTKLDAEIAELQWKHRCYRSDITCFIKPLLNLQSMEKSSRFVFYPSQKLRVQRLITIHKTHIIRIRSNEEPTCIMSMMKSRYLPRYDYHILHCEACQRTCMDYEEIPMDELDELDELDDSDKSVNSNDLSSPQFQYPSTDEKMTILHMSNPEMTS